MCDERFAVEGLVSSQNKYADDVPHGAGRAGDLDVQHIERLCVPGELCGHFSGHPAGEPAHLRPERRLGGVWPDASGEQKDAGGGKIPHRSVLRCGGCCDRRTVHNGDLSAHRNDPDKDVHIEFKSEASEVAAIMASAKEETVAMLPQPFATTVLMNNKEARIALDVTKEWENVSKDGSTVVTGVIVVNTEYYNNHKAAVDKFLEEYKLSADYVNANVDEVSPPLRILPG